MARGRQINKWNRRSRERKTPNGMIDRRGKKINEGVGGRERRIKWNRMDRERKRKLHD